MIAVAIILGGLGSVAVWRLGLLDRPRVGVSVAADSAAVESRFDRITKGFRRDPPRTRSARFGAPCLTPAPVLVYEVDKTPSMFRLQLARQARYPDSLTDTLVNRYRLQGAGYDPKRGGVLVWEVSPDVVARLRCESGITSIEEVSH
jgi:hypothetical protein